MSDRDELLNSILNETADGGKNAAAEAPAEEAPAEEMPAADHYSEPEINGPETYENVPEPVSEPVQEQVPSEEYAPQGYAPQGYDPGRGDPRMMQDPRRAPAPRKKKKKKKKRRHSRLPGVLILVTLIFGVSIISSIVIIGYGKDMLGIGKSEQTHLIVIPEGISTQEISVMLQDDGIIKSAKAFELFSRLRKAELSFVAGEHFIRPNMPYETLIDELTKVPTEEMGESIQVTIPEGTNLIDASYILEENGICDAEQFQFYFNSGGFGVSFEELLPLDSSLKFQRMEGYLFPDTYFFYENSSPEEVCQKIYFNFDQKMTPERRQKMEKLGLSLDELVTFASIVQKEAATTDVMSRVASVFWNRLENSDDFPLLQSDPTSNYSKDVIRPNMEFYDQVKIDSYDTYKSPGLPPGAICNPGIEAIDAVLEKKKTDDFYFIANINTKMTYFSKTLEEHNQWKEEIDRQYEEERLAEANAE